MGSSIYANASLASSSKMQQLKTIDRLVDIVIETRISFHFCVEVLVTLLAWAVTISPLLPGP